MKVHLDFADTPLDEDLVAIEASGVTVVDNHLIILNAEMNSGFIFDRLGVPLSSLWAWYES